MGMRRDLSSLLDTTFDLLVVGAGIHGACIAWDASLRGLSVAIVDRADFGAATSANSLGIVHGGLRYLARADVPRMLESIRERSTFLRIAPGLVEPLPVLVPTYHAASRSRLALSTALWINDLISRNRNHGLEPGRCIPGGRVITRDECLALFPWFPREGLTGGAVWYDARLKHPERLTLGFVRSAAERGAVAANYVRVDRLLVRDGLAQGAAVTDLDGGSQFEIRARSVIVAAGPWTSELIAGTLGPGSRAPAPERALAVNVRVDRSLAKVAIGTKARNGWEEDPICGGGRFLFAAPRGGGTLLGTWYTVHHRDAGAAAKHGARMLVQEFNQACPGLELSMSEVIGYQWGWLPLKGISERGRATALAERPRIVEHRVVDRVLHLLSVEGVKYTTARSVAERAVDWVFKDLGRKSPRCQTAAVLLDIPSDAGAPDTGGTLNRAAIQRAVHQEMALKLSDVVFRRTGLAALSPLSRARLEEVARLTGAELGWDTLRQESEVDEVIRQASATVSAEEPVG
jgi:glycerol-3-phosphate dehydrogenase